MSTKQLLKEIPDFENEDEIANFMEQHNGFELLDQGLAEIVETPKFKRKYKNLHPLLNGKKVNIFCKDNSIFKKLYPDKSDLFIIKFIVINTDTNGILIVPESNNYEKIFIPYDNISGIKVLE